MNIFVFVYNSDTASFQLIKSESSLRYRTFSLKSNNLPTFSEITQVWQYLKH